jgi:hypothetical protein
MLDPDVVSSVTPQVFERSISVCWDLPCCPHTSNEMLSLQDTNAKHIILHLGKM